jgi:putative lipoic acid-binding regulatory protein
MAEPTTPVVMEYPGVYTFRVVTRAHPDIRQRLRVAVESVMGAGSVPDHAFLEHRPSSAGKYVAVHFNVTLESEDQRRDVYVRLKADEAVMFML